MLDDLKTTHQILGDYAMAWILVPVIAAVVLLFGGLSDMIQFFRDRKKKK